MERVGTCFSKKEGRGREGEKGKREKETGERVRYYYRQTYK